MFGPIFIPRPPHLLSPFLSPHGSTPQQEHPPPCGLMEFIPSLAFAVRHLFISFLTHPFLCTILATTALCPRISAIHRQSADSGVDTPGFRFGSSPSACMWCEGKCKGGRRGWVLPVKVRVRASLSLTSLSFQNGFLCPFRFRGRIKLLPVSGLRTVSSRTRESLL